MAITRIERLGKVASTIIDEMSSLGEGYDVYYKILNAKDYGVAQNRERVFIIGVRKDIGYKFHWPLPSHGPNSPKKKQYVTLKKAIGDIPLVADESYDGYFSSRYISRNRVTAWDNVSFTIPAQAGQVPLHPDSCKMGNIDDGIFFETEKGEWSTFRRRFKKFWPPSL